MRVSNPRLHKQYGRDIRNFDIAVWEYEQDNIARFSSYAKLALHSVIMRSHLLDTGDRLLAEAGPYGLI